MDPIQLIESKKQGRELPADELSEFVQAVAAGSVPDYQAAAFLMAVWFRGMNAQEMSAYTSAIQASGRTLDLSALGPITADKHSTGGVGDKVSLILAPAVAACGVPVPMLSGRGLGHTGGTLDKLESISGFRSDFGVEDFLRVVGEAGCAIVGQTRDLAPADKVLYALRDVTATVDSLPLIVGSIVGKKLAAGPAALVYDVKVGRGAFMKGLEDARALARALVAVTRSNGRRASSLITAMDQPLGCMVGNALEVCEAVQTLDGRGPADLRMLVLELGAEMLCLAGVVDGLEAGIERMGAVLDGGQARDRFDAFVRAQGGDPGRAGEPLSPLRETVTASSAGWVESLDALEIGHLACSLGAGRVTVDDVIDPSVGVELHRRIGDSVVPGDPLATLHLSVPVPGAADRLRAAYSFCDEPVEPPRLVLERVGDAHL